MPSGLRHHEDQVFARAETGFEPERLVVVIPRRCTLLVSTDTPPRTFSPHCASVSGSVFVSPAVAGCNVTASTAPVSRSTACSALSSAHSWFGLVISGLTGAMPLSRYLFSRRTIRPSCRYNRWTRLMLTFCLTQTTSGSAPTLPARDLQFASSFTIGCHFRGIGHLSCRVSVSGGQIETTFSSVCECNCGQRSGRRQKRSALACWW